MSTTARGRQDRAGGSLLSWQARANLSMAGLAVGVALVWHLAVWVTSDGLGLSDIARTLKALVSLHPLTLEGWTPQAPW